MAWNDTMVPLLRGLIGDDVSPYQYTDSRLEELIVSAGFFVNATTDFNNDFTIDVALQTITPDPVTVQDNSFINLTLLKAALMLANSDLKTASLKAISVRDGVSGYDGRAVAEAKLAIATQAQKNFDQATKEFRAGNRTPGEAIISPHRIPTLTTIYFPGRV